MSQNNNVRTSGTRTSDEAAASANPVHDEQWPADQELEAYGELPGSFYIPLPEPEPAPVRRPSAKPRKGSSYLELAAKWGVSDGVSRTDGGRATRRSTRAAQSGPPEPVHTAGVVDAAELREGESHKSPARAIAREGLSVEKRALGGSLTPEHPVEKRALGGSLTPGYPDGRRAFGGSLIPGLPVETRALGGSQSPGLVDTILYDVLAMPGVTRAAHENDDVPWQTGL